MEETAPARKRRRRRMLIAAFVLLVLAGGWWGLAPRSFRHVARYPLESHAWRDRILISPLGFCIEEEPYVFCMRDWSGRELWRVATALPAGSGWSATIAERQQDTYLAATSADGHCLAVLSADGARARVQTWRDGAALGEIRLALPHPSGPVGRDAIVSPITGRHHLWGIELYLLSDGRCYCTLTFIPVGHKGRVTYIYLVQGDRLLASTTYPEGGLAFSSTSNTVYFDSNAYATVQRKGKTLTFSPPVAVSGLVMVHPDGSLLRNSDVYRLAGGADWNIQNYSYFADYAVTVKGTAMKVVALKGGQTWDMRVKDVGAYYSAEVSDDGRFLLAQYDRAPSPWAKRLARYLPGFADRLLEERNYFALYRRPGRLLAWHRMKSNQIDNWYLSPDGRTLLREMDGKCALYRY